MNSVNNILSLIEKNSLTYELKIEIKTMLPPRPLLNINQGETSKKTTKSFTRKFNMNLYSSESWLCGCDIRNAFFCYVCLVINSSQSDSAWILRGVTDLKHLGEKIKRHRLSERHMYNCVEFSMLGKVNIVTQLDSAYRLSIEQYNENVRKNRYILNNIINCVKFCGVFELALRGHDETSDSVNPGIFRSLVNFSAEIDSTLREHLKNSKDQTFVGLSKTIQNELLQSMYSVSLNLIYKEIRQADYIAIQADETTDCATISQMVFVVRYELKGFVYERFIGFLVPESHTAEGVSSIIFKELEKLEINETPEKLVAQSYDGASVMSGKNSGVQARIKNLYKNAHYIHCYAHQLNLIMERASSQNKQVRVFFSDLEGFTAFFSRSPKRTAVLDEVVKKRLPRSSTTRWNFKSRCVVTVFTHKNDIIACLEQIIDDSESDKPTLRQARGLKNYLQDYDFNFWLDFYNKIMPSCDILFNQLQHREIDAIKVQTYINTFKSVIQHVRNSIDHDHYREETQDDDDDGPISKRPRYNDRNVIVAKEVCDLMLTSIDDRFSCNDHVTIGSLFEPKLFTKYQLLFPDKEVQIAAKMFCINEIQLKHELKVIYNRPDFCNASGALTLLRCFYDNNLTSVFPESVKLLKIICTMPMTTAECERCFSTLKRIKTFTRNTMKQERLSALAMCSIERKLVQETENFNELVIDHFAQQKDRRIDLKFKNIN